MDIFSDLIKSASGALGSALGNGQNLLVQNAVNSLLPKLISGVFKDMDAKLQNELAQQMKEIVSSFSGDNAKDLDWSKLLQSQAAQTLMANVVKYAGKEFGGK